MIFSQVIQGVVKKYSVAGFKDTRGKFKRKMSRGQILATEHVKKFPFFYIEQVSDIDDISLVKYLNKKCGKFSE